jgi:hypothetical protein
MIADVLCFKDDRVAALEAVRSFVACTIQVRHVGAPIPVFWFTRSCRPTAINGVPIFNVDEVDLRATVAKCLATVPTYERPLPTAWDLIRTEPYSVIWDLLKDPDSRIRERTVRMCRAAVLDEMFGFRIARRIVDTTPRARWSELGITPGLLLRVVKERKHATKEAHDLVAKAFSDEEEDET